MSYGCTGFQTFCRDVAHTREATPIYEENEDGDEKKKKTNKPRGFYKGTQSTVKSALYNTIVCGLGQSGIQKDMGRCQLRSCAVDNRPIPLLCHYAVCVLWHATTLLKWLYIEIRVTRRCERPATTFLSRASCWARRGWLFSSIF